MSMPGRRRLLALVLLAAALHAIGIARTILPAQDGLKFIRIARQFQTEPAFEVIRSSDQHPLYPGLIALAQPLVAAVAGDGPEAWRIAAQLVAAIAAVGALVPLYGLARGLFGDRIAALSMFLFVVFPLPMEIGHDTLSDSLALLATLAALRLGARGLERVGSGPGAATFDLVGCGLCAGLGYLARPEVTLVPLAVGLALMARSWPPERLQRAAVELSTLGVVFLALVGLHALVKGEVSGKLALRYGTGLGTAAQRQRPQVRRVAQWLPPGLDDPRWDFSPKEEPPPAERGRSARGALMGLIARWSEGLGGIFGLFAIGGALRARALRERSGQEEPTPRLRLLLTIYLLLDCLALVRHVVLLGYLSDRHVLPLVAVALPWAAAGTDLCARWIAGALGWTPVRARRWGTAVVALVLLAVLVVPQVKPGHRSRWGHWAAGRWLGEHAQASDAVLDTRGWAAFVSGRPSYDYWHVRQALTDARLAYIVVGEEELSATSRRGATLRAVLAYAASPVAAFPGEANGAGSGVRVYRYHRPDSWEGLSP
jgi:4-amino-4-deoxy-L-arabinose transferase-like glycosyltransferase